MYGKGKNTSEICLQIVFGIWHALLSLNATSLYHCLNRSKNKRCTCLNRYATVTIFQRKFSFCSQNLMENRTKPVSTWEHDSFHLSIWNQAKKKLVKHFIIRVTKVKHGHKTWKCFPPEKKANLSFWLESLLYIQIFVNIFFLHQIWYSKVTHQLFSMEHKIELTIRSIYMLFWSLDCVMRVHPLNHRHLKFTNEKAKWTCFNCIYE